MKSLTRTELRWMCSAMDSQIDMLYKYIEGDTEEPQFIALVKHKIECLEKTIEKIDHILASETKRIEIKA